MTVIPLVVALLVVGIAKSAEAALGGRIAGRSVMWIVIVCTASAIFGAVMIVALTHAFPLPRGTAEGLQSALAGIEQKAAGPHARRRGLLQRRHPRQCLCRGDQRRRPPPGRVRGLVCPGPRTHRRSGAPHGGRPVRSGRRRASRDHRVGVVDCAARGVRARLHRRLGSRGVGLRRARPLCRPDLAHRDSRDPGGISARDPRRADWAWRVQPGDDRAASGRDLDPLVARLASGDADRSARDGRSRAGGRRDLADRGGAVPGDGSGDERRGRLLRRALAWASSRRSAR